MKELKAILAEFKKINFSKRRGALATVVKVHGSSYRSPGARMLITDDGRWVGSISGGCLEGDALRKARQVMQDGKPITITYDTREESNQNLGIGLGCNGVIDVMIEAVNPDDPNNPILLFQEIVLQQGPTAMATLFSGDFCGEKMLINSAGKVLRHFTNATLNQLTNPVLTELFRTHKSEAKTLGTQEIFLELIQPCISLIIFGGGFDARPVSTLAKSLGWDVTVTDECVSHIAPVFFPDADKLSLCQREFIERNFSITPYTACVLMSHNYEYDRDVLKKIIVSNTPYIGLLGPRKRFDKMLEEFRETGFALTPQDIHRIHSPIGLDIGAETPDEIALSIIAEIQSKFANRSGGFLKYRSGPIHQRDPNSDQVFKQIYLGNAGAEQSVNG
jgi:xanthine dehydrogenase accessory factor